MRTRPKTVAQNVRNFDQGAKFGQKGRLSRHSTVVIGASVLNQDAGSLKRSAFDFLGKDRFRNSITGRFSPGMREAWAAGSFSTASRAACTAAGVSLDGYFFLTQQKLAGLKGGSSAIGEVRVTETRSKHDRNKDRNRFETRSSFD